MMEIYPYGGVLAYLKYHYLDSVAKQNLMLIDKTRYDYDRGKEKVTVAQRPKSKEEVKNMVSLFGIGSESETQIARVRKEIGD